MSKFKESCNFEKVFIEIAQSLPEASFKRVAAGSFELDISLLELLTGQGWDF